MGRIDPEETMAYLDTQRLAMQVARAREDFILAFLEKTGISISEFVQLYELTEETSQVETTRDLDQNMYKVTVLTTFRVKLKAGNTSNALV